MGWHRPYRLVLLPAVVALALVLLPNGGAGAEVAAAGPSIAGTVTATGVPEVAGATWTVEHPEPGVYRIAVPATDVVLDVARWEGTPEVTVVPRGGGAAEIRFHLDGIPVDTGFTFTALPR